MFMNQILNLKMASLFCDLQSKLTFSNPNSGAAIYLSAHHLPLSAAKGISKITDKCWC